MSNDLLLSHARWRHGSIECLRSILCQWSIREALQCLRYDRCFCLASFTPSVSVPRWKRQLLDSTWTQSQLHNTIPSLDRRCRRHKLPQRYRSRWHHLHTRVYRLQIIRITNNDHCHHNNTKAVSTTGSIPLSDRWHLYRQEPSKERSFLCDRLEFRAF